MRTPTFKFANVSSPKLSQPILNHTMAPPLEITLIVAATRQMGIGLNGTMPWTGLRKEMAYFRRVTTRTHVRHPPPV